MERKSEEMISVIVPVYNVEKYLDECVQSILRQTYTDFELILVDDGSTDNSGKMCDYYANKDDRIYVIHKENGGLSDARNKGTEKAKGTHITFIDSDDFVSDDYLETLWGLIKKYDADIAVTGIVRFYDGERIKTNDCKRTRIYTGTEALTNVLYQNGMDTSACALLASKNIALNNPFPYGRFHEDDYTTYKYYLEAKRVCLSLKKQYYYRQRKGSIMHSFGQSTMDEIIASDELVHRFKKSVFEKPARHKKFSNYCQLIMNTKGLNETRFDIYNKLEGYLKENSTYVLIDKKARLKNRFAAMLIILGGCKLLIMINSFIRNKEK